MARVWGVTGRALMAGALALAANWATARPALAQAPVADADPGEAGRRTAADIRALLAGRLDPDVDPAALFTLDLGGSALQDGGVTLSDLFRAPPKARRGRKAPPLPGDPAEAAREDLLRARQAFLSLSSERQAKVLADHAARREARERRRARDESDREEAGRVAQQAAQIRALLEGELDLSVDPAPLLVLDLSDPATVAALRPPARPRRAATPTPPDPATGAGALAAAREDRLAALLDFHGRPPTERQALLDLHARRRAEAREAAAAAAAEEAARAAAASEAERRATEAEAAAREAAREKAAAEEAARGEGDEALRRAGEVRVRLLEAREELARIEAEHLQREAEGEGQAAEILALVERTAGLRERETGDGGTGDADALWNEVVDRLETSREEFDRVLGALRKGASELPPAPDPVDLERLPPGERTGVAALRDAVAAERERLAGLEQARRWKEADRLFDAVERLNAARLDLMDRVTPGLRASVTGFGARGLAQVAGAFRQVALVGAYHLLSLPRALDALRDRMAEAPGRVLGGLAKLLLLVLAFRWWRRRGGALLERARGHLEARNDLSPSSHLLEGLLWFCGRIRGPLEWLVLAGLLMGLAGPAARLPEVRIAWLVLCWLLGGLVVFHALDALAERRFVALGGQDRGDLRRRSLRLVGRTGVALGLVLSLTAEAMGRGVVYDWIATAAWVAALPVAAVLASWWRDAVHGILQTRPDPGTLARFVLGHRTGPAGLLAGAAGGVLLLAEGAWRWLANWVVGLSVARRAHAYLFRREMSRQARRRGEEALAPLPPPVLARLAPEAPPGNPLPGIAEGHLQALAGLLDAGGGGLAVIVGERGLGKTTVLDRLAAGLPPEAVLRLACRPEGRQPLWSDLALALDLPVGTGDAPLAEALARRSPRLVCVDDVQRLVRPVVGGLADLDRLCALVRSAGPGILWVLSIGAAAWQFVRRARGARPLFDHVALLRPWNEDQIGALLRGVTADAGLVPSFDGLLADGRHGPLGAEARARMEQKMVRMIWDHADGNPSVALHFWQESLGVDSAGEVRVRLVTLPRTSDIDGLPPDLLFVLRCVVQRDVASAAEVAEATLLRPEQVQDGLRHAVGRGWLEPVPGGVRIPWAWYRTIITALERQHLLATGRPE